MYYTICLEAEVDNQIEKEFLWHSSNHSFPTSHNSTLILETDIILKQLPKKPVIKLSNFLSPIKEFDCL